MVYPSILRARLIGAIGCLALAAVVACSDDDDKSKPFKPVDSGTDSAQADGDTDAGETSTGGTTIGICSELPPADIPAFLDVFTGAPDDCRVSHLYTALLGANKIQEYIDKVLGWTDGFLGCAPAPPVVGFAPGELPGVAIALTQADVDVILDYYMKAMVAGYKLSPAQEATAKAALVELAKTAVKDPAPGHSLDLCGDGGDGGGGDAGVDASPDAGTDASNEASATEGGSDSASDTAAGGG